MKNDWAAVQIIRAKSRKGRVLFCCFSLEKVKGSSCRFPCCSEEPVFMLREERMLIILSDASCFVQYWEICIETAADS